MVVSTPFVLTVFGNGPEMSTHAPLTGENLTWLANTHNPQYSTFLQTCKTVLYVEVFCFTSNQELCSTVTTALTRNPFDNSVFDHHYLCAMCYLCDMCEHPTLRRWLYSHNLISRCTNDKTSNYHTFLCLVSGFYNHLNSRLSSQLFRFWPTFLAEKVLTMFRSWPENMAISWPR